MVSHEQDVLAQVFAKVLQLLQARPIHGYVSSHAANFNGSPQPPKQPIQTASPPGRQPFKQSPATPKESNKTNDIKNHTTLTNYLNI